MTIFELKAEISAETVAAVEDLLAEREEQRLMLLEDKPAARAWITGYFESRDAAAAAWETFAASLDPAWARGNPEVRELPDQEWKDSYKAHFRASRFGPLHWVPVWEKATYSVGPAEKVLWLDPGMAFGTGNHETTRLVAERLVSFAETHGTGGRVIDAGCGSGILALSAVRLGFRSVSGFDNDPEAIRVSGENAALNGLKGSVEFFVGDLVSGLAGRRAALVLANIQADVLVRFVRELVDAIEPGGQLVLSGILARELEATRTAFAAVVTDWRIDSRTEGEWSDLLLERPAASA